jgi:hypothetical protein
MDRKSLLAALVVLLVTLAPQMAEAQSAGGITRLSSTPTGAPATEGKVDPLGSGPTNPWAFGTQIATAWGDDLASGNTIIGAGLLVWSPKMNGPLAVHFLGNVSNLAETVVKGREEVEKKLREVAMTPRGIDLRGYLEWLAKPRALGSTEIAAWVSGGYRVNGMKEHEDSSASYAHQLKYTGGLELRLGREGKPVTLGVEYVASRIAGSDVPRILSLSTNTVSTFEGTLVVPLARTGLPALENMGFLVQGIAGVSKGMPGQGRVGILVAK